MHVISLISSPETRILSAALLEKVKASCNGGAVTWLAADEAAEFVVADVPERFGDLWQLCQDQAIDLNIMPANDRRKSLLIADMDSTMIQQECIDELAAEAGVGERVAEITAKAMNGELDFEGAIDERVSLLKELPATIIDHVLQTRITYMPGGATLLATMKANGAYAALVSGGFTAFTSQVAAQLGFDENRANTLEIANDHLTGKVVRPILGQEAKLNALNEITTRLSISKANAIAVGDGMNDLLMLQNAGLGVALHGKPALQQQAKIRINHGDLTALLYLQGYPRTEFVTP